MAQPKPVIAALYQLLRDQLPGTSVSYTYSAAHLRYDQPDCQFYCQFYCGGDGLHSVLRIGRPQLPLLDNHKQYWELADPDCLPRLLDWLRGLLEPLGYDHN